MSTLTNHIGVSKVGSHHERCAALGVSYVSCTIALQEQLQTLHLVIEGSSMHRSPVRKEVCVGEGGGGGGGGGGCGE